VKLLDWNILLSYVSDLTDWLPLMIYFSLDKKRKILYRFLGAYLLINSILKTSTFVILNIRTVNTLPFYHLLSVFEFVFLFLFFSQTLQLQRGKWLLLFGIALLNIANTMFYQTIYEFNSYSWAGNSMILVSMGLFVLYKIYLNIEDIALNQYPLFIINSGLLIYLSGSLFTYILGSDILSQEAKDFFHNAWIIKSISDIIKSALLTVGLWVAKRN
jgi:hypothetical protein